MATFAKNFNGLLFRSILRMCVQNLKFIALPIPEIIGGTHKIWAVPGYAHTPFSTKFLKGFCSEEPCEAVNVSAKFAVRSFTRSWDNSACIFALGLWTPNLREGKAILVGDGTVWKSGDEFL